MEETLIRLENLYEHALRAYLDALDTEREADAYHRFLETFETLKTFEEVMDESMLAVTA